MDRDSKAEINQKKESENQKLLTPQQKKEIKKAFDFFDVTGSGSTGLTRNDRGQKPQGCAQSAGL